MSFSNQLIDHNSINQLNLNKSLLEVNVDKKVVNFVNGKYLSHKMLF